MIRTGKQNFFVSAGAGAGKTTALSRRVAGQLADGVSPREFVIITFTNAAAEELRGKIQSQLRKAEETEPDPKRKQYIRKALAELELMIISTIHSFLLGILKEYCFESHLALDAVMIDDDEDRKRKQAFLDEWIKLHTEQVDALREDWTFPNKTDGRETDHTIHAFQSLFMDMASVREEVVLDMRDRTEEYERRALEYCRAYKNGLSMLPQIVNENAPVGKSGKSKGLPVEPVMDVKAALIRIPEICEMEDGLEKACDMSGVITVLLTKPCFGSYANRADANRTVLEHVPGSASGKSAEEMAFGREYREYAEIRRANVLASMVKDIARQYQDRIDLNTEQLSNDEILYRSWKLLSDHPKICAKLHRKYTHIYVDEFQDTTQQQSDIVRMLARDNPVTEPEYRTAPDSLFIVGDRKQSIYRFTGAQIQVFDEMRLFMEGMPEEDAKVLNLDYNFRSNKEIVDWVNASFQTLLNKGTSTYQNMLTEHITQDQTTLHGVYRLDPIAGYDQAADIEKVTQIVRTLTDDDRYQIEEYDPEKKAYHKRRIRYSDFMILFRATTQMPGYVDRFSALGIPVDVMGRIDVSSNEALLRLRDVLRYFATPKVRRNRYAAAQVISGYSDLSNTTREFRGELYQELRQLQQFFDDNHMDTAAVAEYITEHEELYYPRKELSQADMRLTKIRVNQCVQSCLAKLDGDLARFVSLMDHYIESSVGRELPLERAENAVRMMNVHKAKGLTGNIVIIADRRRKESPGFAGFRNRGKYYPSVDYSNPEYYSMSQILPTYKFLEEEGQSVYELARQQEEEEAIRLQYVACTRAAYALIIMQDRTRKNGAAAGSWFSDPAYDVEGTQSFDEWLKERGEPKNGFEKEAESLAAKGVRESKDNMASLRKMLHCADMEKMARGITASLSPSQFENANRTIGYVPGDKGYEKEVRPVGSTFGNAMHRAFELVLRRRVLIREENRQQILKRCVNQAVMESADDFQQADSPEQVASYLADVIGRYWNEVLIPILQDAREVYPELPYSFYVSENERDSFCREFAPYARKEIQELLRSEKIWLNGKMDLVVVHKDGSVTVYDFKSDSRNGKPIELYETELQEKYAGQLALYRFSAEKLFSTNQITTELIHLYL